MKKVIIALVSVIGLAVVGLVGWYLASPLFFDDVVDEAFPVAEQAVAAPSEDVSQVGTGAQEEVAMPDKVMDDPMPETASNEPAVLVQGQFQDADNFHQGSGSATVYQLRDGGQVLRFEDFEVTNGPELHVILTKHPAPAASAEVGEDYIDLGLLKGNIGSQNYDIPAGVDLSEYQSVVIYCKPFHVIFSVASLS